MNGFYYCPGSHMVSRGQRVTLMQRIRLWLRRRNQNDLANLRGWVN